MGYDDLKRAALAARKPVERPKDRCLSSGCDNVSRRANPDDHGESPWCWKHERRITRLGSPEAFKCIRCHCPTIPRVSVECRLRLCDFCYAAAPGRTEWQTYKGRHRMLPTRYRRKDKTVGVTAEEATRNLAAYFERARAHNHKRFGHLKGWERLGLVRRKETD